MLINTTPVGMRETDEPLIDPGKLPHGLIVYDLVYNRATRLVREARRRGCLAAGGVSMLVYQGAEAFRLWWRRNPPTEAMRQAVEQALRRGSPSSESTVHSR